jgi:hypothetical protein
MIRDPSEAAENSTESGIVPLPTMHEPTFGDQHCDCGPTVRLIVEQAADIETIAQVEGVSVAEEIRAALADRIAARRIDADFAA